MTISIRAEQPEDHNAIWRLTKQAFSGMSYAAGDEQDLINTLRDVGALSVSLVAIDVAVDVAIDDTPDVVTDADKLVGQVTFSPASISSHQGIWFALGPISVTPTRQGEGIGGKLIEAGIQAIKELGAWGCILTGNPDYYSRHGFSLAADHCPAIEPSEYFMLRLIGEHKPLGIFSFHNAFYPVV